jgi:hypothetical protein
VRDDSAFSTSDSAVYSDCLKPTTASSYCVCETPTLSRAVFHCRNGKARPAPSVATGFFSNSPNALLDVPSDPVRLSAG